MATDITESQELKGTEINKYDFKTKTTAVFKARKGIDEEIVRQISKIKEEPCLLYTSPSPRDRG